MARFFIEHPVFAMVIAIVIVILGAVAIPSLPVASYPEVVPPVVQITTSYLGGNSLDLYQEGEGRSPEQSWQGEPAAGLHASRDSLYRTARGEKQHRPRGDPLGPPPEAMSGLPRRYDHRPWTAAPPGPR